MADRDRPTPPADDIIDRLRAEEIAEFDEAADEIDRLRALLDAERTARTALEAALFPQIRAVAEAVAGGLTAPDGWEVGMAEEGSLYVLAPDGGGTKWVEYHERDEPFPYGPWFVTWVDDLMADPEDYPTAQAAVDHIVDVIGRAAALGTGEPTEETNDE